MKNIKVFILLSVLGFFYACSTSGASAATAAPVFYPEPMIGVGGYVVIDNVIPPPPPPPPGPRPPYPGPVHPGYNGGGIYHGGMGGFRR